jgi:hypothetical protein
MRYANPRTSSSRIKVLYVMRVIGVGFGRTGTTSLQVALERIGCGPCYHVHTTDGDRATRFDLGNIKMQVWVDAAKGRPTDWREVFAGYESMLDWPGAAFWRELLAAFPDAKVILTVRDPERWYASARKTIFRAAGWSRWITENPLLLRISSMVEPGFGEFSMMFSATVLNRVFDGRAADREYAIAVFKQHIANVQAEVPADRLLVYEVKQGWQPLCAFLGVPVPDEPFPHVNDGAEFERRIQQYKRRALPGMGAVATVAGGGARVFRRRSQ